MPTPIIVLGGGIGGLTLGRCLRQKGIPYIIYERTSSAPRHNYGITLHSWSYRALLKILDIDELDFHRRVAVDSRYHGGQGKVFPSKAASANTTASTSFRAHRSRLENLLAEGQQIHREHLLTAAIPVENQDRVELSFQYPFKTTGYKLLVDTLGVHSQLRKSLLPDCTPKVLPYVVFNGRRHVTANTFRDVYAPHLADSANVLESRPRPDAGVLLQIWVNDHHQPDAGVDIGYTYSRPARPDGHADPLHNPARPAAGATHTPDELYHELERLVEEHKLEEPFRSTFDPATVRRDRLLHWLMRTVLVARDDLNRLAEQSAVVMMGDSAHATPILGGHGASDAIEDAVRLADVIARCAAEPVGRGIDGDADAAAAIREFYEEAWPRWRRGVEGSETAIADMHDGRRRESVL